MNRKLFKLKNIAMVAVFSLVAFVGFNSFKSVSEMRTDSWYLVEIVSGQQQLTTEFSAAEPTGLCPETSPTGNILCAVRVNGIGLTGTKIADLPGDGYSISSSRYKEDPE